MSASIHKSDAGSPAFKGTEHLLPGQNVFQWRLAPAVEPELPTGRAERNRVLTLRRYHDKKSNKTVAQQRADVLRVNPESNIAHSTTGAGERAARIRKQGVI
jgi:hypothetical protein